MRIVPPRRLRRRPGVTVVIPCYNYGRFLPGAVHAALDQEGVDVRVIVVDDRSTDASREIARDIASTDDRVEVVEHARNLGLVGTLNDGLSRVTTEYVTAVSADDVLGAGALRRACGLLDAHPRVGLVHGKAVWFSGAEDMRPTGLSGLDLWTIWKGSDFVELAAREGRNPVMSPTAVMRTAALRDVGDYDASLPHTCDFDMWLRTAARWDVGWIRGAVQAYYRVHGGNMHMVEHGTEAANLSGLLDAFDKLGSAEVTESLPRGPEYRSSARATIADRAIRTAEAMADSGDLEAVTALASVAIRADPTLAARAALLGQRSAP